MIERSDDEIRWGALTLDFPPEVEARLEENAREEGLSLKSYCVRVLYKHLLENASASEKEKWQRDFSATLRRNVCG